MFKNERLSPKTLLSKQFLFGCSGRNHACSHLLEEEPPPRNIRRKYDIQPYTDFRQAFNPIHSGAANTFTDSLPVNDVLEVQTPPTARRSPILETVANVKPVQIILRWTIGICSAGLKTDYVD